MKLFKNISGLIIFSVFVTLAAGWGLNQGRFVPSVEVDISTEPNINRSLISEHYIKDFVARNTGIELDLLTHIDNETLLLVRDAMLKNIFVRDAKVYFNQTGELKIQIFSKEPIARVIDQKGKNFYITNIGDIVPYSKSYSPRVMIVLGETPLPDMQSWDDLVDLVQYIHKDDFLKALIESVHFEEQDHIIMTPKLGDFKIDFGSPSHVNEKFDKLKSFYESTYDKIDWKKYGTIKLDYKDQIVLKKKTNRT